jgi:hypothetical protein
MNSSCGKSSREDYSKDTGGGKNRHEGNNNGQEPRPLENAALRSDFVSVYRGRRRWHRLEHIPRLSYRSGMSTSIFRARTARPRASITLLGNKCPKRYILPHSFWTGRGNVDSSEYTCIARQDHGPRSNALGWYRQTSRGMHAKR